jgi:GNAT superfamily N-acetyltransferase
MSLRVATVADIPAMHRVRMAVRENRLSDPSRVTEADCVEHLDSLGRGWVVEHHHEIVGFAVGRVTDGNIWALFVMPDCEGLGYGTMLHDAMIDWLFEQGLPRLWLTTERGTRAERFYLQKHWVPSGPGTTGEVCLELLRA